jgi:hypothetical protein
MGFDAPKVDSSISRELSADYWRERAECLEEWVCELLRKNQALRMDLQMVHSEHRRREEMSLASPPLSQSSFSSVWPTFRTTSTKLGMEADMSSCPRKECAEVRESVVQSTVRHEPVRGATNERHHTPVESGERSSLIL